ncbi:FAD-dependent thymidylate synthase [Corynebacterium testudinoris]|uniref:Flavin-dependent thymidylate synthase n=1 Tax=Corynebacterium testudinoris TaxID=136857 RepID=A0A0G3H6M1_9CORY|nr:FAD-dependent thymidylate synthase [Corynebacterium testudinoris]AKK09019.1 thymidylate synthase, flavin-dependent [Corynebacterium testudinoris]MBX8995424.1 FAD-dependent thymidylate synthase [Corynebacterium testudinoris]
MAKPVELDVQLIAATEFFQPAGVEWSADAEATDTEALVEFAGRACYESFAKPNPRTAANDAYLRHIMEVGHWALLEHATATLYIRGLSRSASHELVRHRHFSFSQLSQRFVHTDEAEVVLPPLVAEDPQLRQLVLNAVDESRFVYQELLDALEEKLDGEPNALLRKKQARQAARAVLPNATESRIVVTGNFRTWRHFIGARATEHADVEIRALAVACLKVLRSQSPVLFSDFQISTLADGSEMAVSPYATDL